jgi:hypothetical protein
VAPKFGAHVEGDRLEQGVYFYLPPTLMIRPSLLALQASFEGGSFGFGVAVVLVACPPRVVLVPRFEAWRTYCCWRRIVRRLPRYDGMEPTYLASERSCCRG